VRPVKPKGRDQDGGGGPPWGENKSNLSSERGVIRRIELCGGKRVGCAYRGEGNDRSQQNGELREGKSSFKSTAPTLRES